MKCNNGGKTEDQTWHANNNNKNKKTKNKKIKK